ncbi:MAG: ABC transporter permease [Patulibacter sp.]
MSATPAHAPASAPDATPGPPRRLGRLERSALTGVLMRDIINFSAYWRGSAFSSMMEPTTYLLAFGFGFGSIVSQVAGYDYIDFVGTGTVATAVLFSTAMPAMFNTWVRHKFQGTYDAILAAPVDTEELVTAEAAWMAIRAGAFGCAPLVVALAFGLEPRGWMLVVPLINLIAGFGWACFGVCVAAFLKTMESFSYVTSGFITPVMLTAGTFFPLTNLPHWVQVAGWLNPLHHTVELVRHASFGWQGWVDAAHLAILIAFALTLWRVAVWGMQRKLIS